MYTPGFTSDSASAANLQKCRNAPTQTSLTLSLSHYQRSIRPASGVASYDHRCAAVRNRLQLNAATMAKAMPVNGALATRWPLLALRTVFGASTKCKHTHYKRGPRQLGFETPSPLENRSTEKVYVLCSTYLAYALRAAAFAAVPAACSRGFRARWWPKGRPNSARECNGC